MSGASANEEPPLDSIVGRVRRLWRSLVPTRPWPIHRSAAIVLVAALALPNELVTVSFGDLWPAGPPLLYPVLAAARSADLLLFDASGPVKRFLMRRMIFGART